MKIRNGFVSNSSSSSFIILLPKKFDVEAFVEENYSKWENTYVINDFKYDYEHEVSKEFIKEEIIKVIKKFKLEKSFEQYDNSNEMRIIERVLKEYCIASMDTASDSGTCELMSDAEVKRIKER